jgi:D-alanyl-D-alanine carboxypeptidase (penicillin-binding protein 5/6)
VTTVQGHFVRHLRAFSTRLVPLLLLFIVVLTTSRSTLAQTADPASLEMVSATRFIVIDSATGEVFAEQEAEVRGGMASLTKVFTALVAIERASSLDQQIVAQDSDMFDSTSTTMSGFAPGVVFTVRDLLYGMMLESGNDAATALARGIAEQDGDSPEDSVRRFVEWMNEKSAELGLTNTNFVNPHGLSDPDHYSTPRELAAFTMVALENPTFLDVITARTYTTTTGVTIASVNRGPEFMQSYIGGKTGFDEDTGYCLIEIAQREDVRLISVTIDGVAPDVWYQDHAILLEYGFNALNDRLASGEPLGSNVVSVANQQAEVTEPEPEPETADPGDQEVAVIVGDDDDIVGPVRIDGTPVPVVQASNDDGNSLFDNWAVAVLLSLVVFGSLLLRSRRSGSSSQN